MPVFGAGTSNSEYEVLTGNSTQFLVQGSTPYQMNVKDEEYGLATTLETQGYKPIALHPYVGTNWDRNNVYEKMGFDEFYSKENWGSKIDNIRWCASDKSAYDKVIELDEQIDEKMFVFLVTMQNHAGYDHSGYENSVSLNYQQDYPLTEQYLSLLQNSDEAFKGLVEYYEKREDNTLIIMFGDHQASIEDDFYGELFGKPVEELSFEESQQRFITPFYIWANYDIEEATDVQMSSNYFGSYILDKAGVRKSIYNEFLLDMQKDIPIIGQGGFCDNAGTWYTFENAPELLTNKLNEYRILQYNYVYDRNNRVDDIFIVK